MLIRNKKGYDPIIIKKIFSHYCEKYGKPEKIICDHGTQFTAKKWQDKLEEEKIQLIYSSIRHPQGNIVERVNRELGKFSRIFVKDNHTAWACYVPLIQEIINETCHDSTEMTPYELHFNKKPVRPWTKWIKKPAVQGKDKNHEEIIELAAGRIRKQGAARKKAHDERRQ